MLSRQEVLDEVREVMAQLGLGPSDVPPQTRLVADLDLDSLDWVDLAMRLEERLQVPLREERFAALRTVDDVIRHVEKALAARGPE
jgi:acyl carrier protein